MKILMIAPEPFFEPRGTPISVYQRLQALSALRYQVDLLTYHVGKDVDIPGVTIHRSPYVPIIKNVKIGPSWAKIFLDILLFCQAITLLALNRYDVIHSHEEAAFFSAFLSKVFRTRHIYDMHSSLPQQLTNFSSWNFWPLVRLFQILEKWVINTCDAVITIGEDLEEHVINIAPTVRRIRIDNLAIGTHGSNPNYYSAPELKEMLGLYNQLLVVYTGTFELYQGLDLLMESARVVCDDHPEVSFVLAGGKPHQVEHWQVEARKRDLEDHVRFVGTVSPDEALIYLEMADILVSPRVEGTSVPLKIYSYLNSGKPTVATNLVAHTQVLNEDIALLVPPTKEAFAEGILKLVNAPHLRQALGRRAQEFAQERFATVDYVAKVNQIYGLIKASTRTRQESALSPESAPHSSLEMES